MTISDELVENAADLIVQGSTDYCECRRSPFDKHTVNPPCSTRRDATRVARVVLEAAAGIIRAECLEEAADAIEPLWFSFNGGRMDDNATRRDWLRARAVAERGEG